MRVKTEFDTAAAANWRRRRAQAPSGEATSTSSSCSHTHPHRSTVRAAFGVAALAAVVAMSGCVTSQDEEAPPLGEFGYQFVIRHESRPHVFVYASEVYRTYAEVKAALREYLNLRPSHGEFAEVIGVPSPDDGSATPPYLAR